MPKIVLVETVSMFRHTYAVELPDSAPNDWALDDVVCEMSKDSPAMQEVGQKWIGEETFSHRVIDENEYLRVFDDINGPYFATWSDDRKKDFIFKSEVTHDERSKD